MLIRRIDNSVMHPFAFASRADNPRPPQVRQVPRNTRLICLQDLNQKADAHFVVT
jgi:hypothetical protein